MQSQLKQKVIVEIDSMKDRLISIADYIHAHPEQAYEEYKAMEILTEELKEAGFLVEKNILGMETAFTATYDSGVEGPVIGLLAEYDALPMGHACGHNLIGTTAIGAGIALSRFMKDLKGRIIIFGTPAEEAGGGKLPFCEEEVISQADVAILVHPSDKTSVGGTSLAIDSLEFIYHGKASHAAASPHLGINALDAVISLFNNINALRQQLKDDVRIHGIISEGGVAPNIIPEKAVAQFYVRALERKYLDEVVDRVLDCAEGAAKATSCMLKYSNYQSSYDNLITNSPLAEAFTKNLTLLGEEVRGVEREEMMGSTDMGNVSHLVPSIHPSIAIGPEGMGGHTKAFMEAASSEGGYKGLLLGTKAAAMTAVDILSDPELFKRVQEEFSASKRES